MSNRHPAYPDAKPWVREVLANERWYADGAPRWPNAKSENQTRQDRYRMVKVLDKYGTHMHAFGVPLAMLANRVGRCSENLRCMSGACPCCSRAMQRYLVSQWDELLREEFSSCKNVSMLSLIWESRRSLNDVSLAVIQQKAKRLLKEAGIEYLFGGIDISFNQDSAKSDGVWCIHFWLAVPSDDVETWKKELKRLHRSLGITLRPVLVKKFDGNLAGLAYAYKPTFKRRVGYVQTKTTNGVTRTCSNTSEQPLRVFERLQLWQFLDQQGLASRVVLIGVRPTRVQTGISLTKIGSQQKNSEIGETADLGSEEAT